LNKADVHTQVEHPIQPAVTGWLLFFCLNLTLVFPATSLYQIVTQTVSSLIRGHNPKFVFLLAVYCVVFTVLAVFSFIAGLKLWLMKPEAVRFARCWLRTYLVANLAYCVLWLVIAKPHQAAILAEIGWYHAVTPIATFALWYFYLEHSKRVRATYPFR
jgi:hypothetical protein